MTDPVSARVQSPSAALARVPATPSQPGSPAPHPAPAESFLRSVADNLLRQQGQQLRFMALGGLFGRRQPPEPPMPAQPTPAAPPPAADVPVEDLRRAMSERYPRSTEKACLATGSEAVRELQARVERQVLLERGVTDDARVHTPWSYPTPRHCASDTVYDPANATVYTGVGQGHDRYLTAFDAEGRVRWSWPGQALTAPPVVVDGTVYFRTRGTLHACSALGQEKWQAPMVAGGSWEDRAPAVAPDGTVYVIDSLQGLGVNEPNLRLKAVREGQVAWSFDAVGDHTGDPQVLRGRDGTIYLTASLCEHERVLFGLLEGEAKEHDYLIALRPDGSLKFKVAVKYWPSYVATSLSEAPDGTIYAAHGEQCLTAFSPKDGRELWTYELQDRVKVAHASSHARLRQAPAFDADGNVYIATGTSASYPEGYLIRLDPHGREQWVRAVEGGIGSRPHFGPDGMLYLTSDTGELRVFDRDGNQKSATRVGNVSWSNFSFGPDGELFLNTDRQILEYQPDLEKAKKAIYRVEPEAPSQDVAKSPAHDTVQDDGEYVVIGGLRLKKRPAEA